MFWPLAYVAGLHAALLLFDALHPAAFLNCDRCAMRIEAGASLGQALSGRGSLAEALNGYGVAGDYLLQAALLHLAGRFAVIGVQVLLMLAAVWGVFRIGRSVGLSPGASVTAALIYAHLPHTLVFPHQLAAEAVADPLVVLGFAAAATGLRRGGADLARLTLGGLLLGLAAFVRPVLLLWPLAQAPIFLRAGVRPGRAAAFVAAAWAPVITFMLVMLALTGSVGMGASLQDAPHNLYERTRQMMKAAAPPAQAHVQARWLDTAPRDRWGPTLSVNQYAQIAATNPGPYLAYLAQDAAVFAFKSGVEKLTVDYLDGLGGEKSAFTSKESGWRLQAARLGPVGGALFILQRSPWLLVSSGLGVLAMALLDLLALLGAVVVIRQRGPPAVLSMRMAVLALPAYVFAFSQVVDMMQSRHRAPADFALVLLAMLGGAAARAAWRSRRAGV